MKLKDLISNVKIQQNHKIVYYNFKKEKEIEVDLEDYGDREIIHIFTRGNVLFIEVKFEEEIDE